MGACSQLSDQEALSEGSCLLLPGLSLTQWVELQQLHFPSCCHITVDRAQDVTDLQVLFLLTVGALNFFIFIFFCFETIIWLVNMHLLNSICVLYSLTRVEEIQKE